MAVHSLYPFWHIPDRPLAALLGLPNPEGGGKTVVFNARERVRKERGKKYCVKDVDTSHMNSIGCGSQSVYLYYFPAYSTTETYKCNIGKTTGDVENRVSDQTGDQLPEKPKIALIIRTDDCKALEKEIHDRLKRMGRWLDPNSGDDVVGVEWFRTNPAEVEGIVKAIHSTNGENLKKGDGHSS